MWQANELRSVHLGIFLLSVAAGLPFQNLRAGSGFTLASSQQCEHRQREHLLHGNSVLPKTTTELPAISVSSCPNLIKQRYSQCSAKIFYIEDNMAEPR